MQTSTRAVCYIGSDETKARLKPLAIGQAGDDPDDELKGYGLQAVWPTHMTADELFAVLTSPKRESLIGAYRAFLSHDLVQHIQIADLPLALNWVEGHPPRHMLSHPFGYLIDDVMSEAWKHLELPKVLDAFAKAVLSRLRCYDEIVGNSEKWGFRPNAPLWSEPGDDEKRHRVVEALIPLLSGP